MKFAKSRTARVPLGGVYSPAAHSLLLMTGLFTAVLTFDKSTSGASLAAGKLYGGPVSKWREWDEKSVKWGALHMSWLWWWLRCEESCWKKQRKVLLAGGFLVTHMKGDK